MRDHASQSHTKLAIFLYYIYINFQIINLALNNNLNLLALSLHYSKNFHISELPAWHKECGNYNLHIFNNRGSCPRWPRGNVLASGSNPAEVDGFFQDVKILSTSPPGRSLIWGPESEISGSLMNFKPEKWASEQNLIGIFMS